MPKSGHNNFIFEHPFQPLAQMEGPNQDHPWFCVHDKSKNMPPETKFDLRWAPRGA